MSGYLHLKPIVGCQISTLIFELCFLEGGLYKYPLKNILKTAKFLPTWGSNQRYYPILKLTEVPGWVSAPLAHSRVSNINFDIWFFCFEGGLYKYPIKIYIKDGKVLAHLEIKSKVLSWHLTDWNACVGLCTSSPQQVVKYQLWYLILVLEGSLYKYSMKNILRTTKSLSIWGFNQMY